MKGDFEDEKLSFLVALHPYLEMLRLRKSTMSYPDWLQLVHHTKNRIKETPDQYLGKNLPAQNVIDRLVNEIFIENVFLAEQLL